MKIPDESTLRKHYLHSTYLSTVEKIREYIGESYIWATVDETTDRCGRYVANVVVGKPDSTGPGKPHLVVSKMHEATNSSTIAIVFRDALRVLGPSENNDERFFVLLTDSAAYMLKAAASLEVFYAKLIHVTCLAQAVHRVAEDIRSHFTNVNAIISTVKKVFLKNPSRIFSFKVTLPNTPLPPQPVLTRWGTWLHALLYYADYLGDIQRVLYNTLSLGAFPN